MKKCLNCQQIFSSNMHQCLKCAWSPKVFKDFLAYAPDLALESSGFKQDYFASLSEFEVNNFWFCARNNIIIDMIAKHCPDFKSFFEVGCGTGFVLSGIANQFPNRSYLGAEIFVEGLRFAQKRQKSEVKFIQMDARKIPFSNEFDCLGIFDVLEHIEEDFTVLQQIHEALKPEGVLFLTVPQHQWLWSKTDEIACHVRRYSANEIHTKIEQAGFEILESTSFVFFLLPIMMMSRLFLSLKKNEYSELQLPQKINTLFAGILNVERHLIKKGLSLPVGGSRLIIAKK